MALAGLPEGVLVHSQGLLINLHFAKQLCLV